MKKYVFTFALITFIMNLSAIYLTVNGPNPGPNNYTTISDAVANLEEDQNYIIEVFAIGGVETIYDESFEIPVCTVTLKVNEDDIGLVIIDSGADESDLYRGHTAITVLPSQDFIHPNVVIIDGFIIQRTFTAAGEEEDSGIVILTRNTTISNCSFGSRDQNNNFYQSIYFYCLASKSLADININNCNFDKSCDIGEFAIICSGMPYNNNSYKAFILNNVFTDCGKGMSITMAKLMWIIDNELINNEFIEMDGPSYGIYATLGAPCLFSSLIVNDTLTYHDIGIQVDSYWAPFDILGNSLKYQKKGIHIDGGNTSILKNLIHTYQEEDDDDDVVGIFNWGVTSIRSNTLINTDSGSNYVSTAIDCGDWVGGEIYDDYLANTIMWDYDTNVIYPTSNDDLEINYSCFNGDINGFEPPAINDHNLDNEDPLFVSELPENDEFCHLTWIDEENHSPCIDAGDPDAGYDIDGSLSDIGCLPYIHNYDTKHFSPGWQWVSFPVLTNDGTYSVGTYDPLSDELYEQAYFEDGEAGLLQETASSTGTIDDFVEIQGNRGDDIFLTPTGSNYGGGDDGFENELYRTKGYKIFVEGTNTTTMEVYGDRLQANHTLEGTMNSGEYHWLGYWLLNTPQSIVDAFGDFWQSVAKVKSEEWFYSPSNNQRGGDPTIPVLTSPENLTFEYGKTYLVQFNEDVDGFRWTDSSITVEAEKKSEPESFTYTEKADYEAIDVFNIPPNVIEIGVFEDDICVGAVVVEDTCAQILVYSENANRDPIPFTFEVVTGRGISTPIKNYQVLNLQTGKYEAKSIFSNQQEYSIIRFGDDDEPEDNTLSTPQLHGNYPNPFNPTTTISFSLPEEQEIDLTIYNIKGQKVKQLINGHLTTGQHSMIWDGKDTNGKSVSTGIYFYKLKTSKKEISRKMLLLK